MVTITTSSCTVKMNLPKTGKYFLVIGLIFLIFGFFSAIVIPKVIEIKITEQTRLINNSETFNKWKSPDLPIYIRFFFYNVTNSKNVLKGDKPIFQEVGPIVYQERRLKAVDDIDTEKDTLTFRQSITYTFRPDLSNLWEDDLITTLNIPLAGISKKGLSMGLEAGIMRDELHEYMDHHPGEVNVFNTRKVKELLFTGYYDGLLEDMAKLAGNELFPNHIFGIYVGKNGTWSLPLTIDAGVKDYGNFGKIVNFNGASEMNAWNDEYCNRLNGSDGSLFPPFVTKDRKLRVFSEEACRSIYMTFKEEVDYFGVVAYRFHLPPQIWASASSYPDNKCFCTSPANCERSGLMDISPCKKGAPVFASLPHFLYGDQELWNRSGVEPSREKDETYLDVEPTTGLLLGAMKRFQVNIDLWPNSRVRGFRYVPKMIFPILWGEEFFISNQKQADFLTENLLNPMRIVSAFCWTSFTIGSIFILVGNFILLLLLLMRKFVNEETKESTNEALKIFTNKRDIQTS